MVFLSGQHEHREILHSCKGMVLDLALLNPLKKSRRSLQSQDQPGYAIRDADSIIRINAVHFALTMMMVPGPALRSGRHHPHRRLPFRQNAHQPLPGQFSLFAANYPLTEDDFDDLRLPKALQEHKTKLFGLT